MKTFELWPAIDLINGKPVRLYQGDFNKKTEFNVDIKNLVKTFNKFAIGIHIVDLDGAKSGKPKNIDLIKLIVQYSEIPVEIGGGIRTIKDADDLFNNGVSRIIIGTKAIDDMEFIQNLISKFGTDKIVVGIDTKNAYVATEGWLKTSEIKADKLMINLQKIGIKNIIYTDIAYDGTLTGSPISLFKNVVLSFPELNIIASGGVANINDLKNLKEIGAKGVIFGRAFYEEKITPEELINFKKENA